MIEELRKTLEMPQRGQDLEKGVMVPLVQNLAGGAAAAILITLITYGWNEANHLATDYNDLTRWALIAGGIVAASFTIFRFFGDEIGIFRAIYNAGRHSRDDEVQLLHRQINALQMVDQQNGNAASQTSAINARLGVMAGDLENAQRLLLIRFAGQSIARDNGSHNLTKQPWTRAVRLLQMAKVYDPDTGELLIVQRNDAQRTLTEFYTPQYKMAQNSEKFVVPWWK